MDASREVVIISAVRTPIGSLCGSLSTLKASELGSIVIRESLRRAKLKPEDVDEVILGQALTAGQGQNPARQASIRAGVPLKTPAYLINMLCGSGLKSIANGCMSIRCGDNRVVVAGGQESMSQANHASYLRGGVKLGDVRTVDTLLHDGLTDAFCNIHMGVTAENIARAHKITRQEQDILAAESQQKTENSVAKGYFDEEIVPVTVTVGRETKVVAKDEFPKPGTTVEKLGKLKPAFVESDGTVTAGNATGANDGAAVVVLMSKEEASKRGIKPLARIVATAEGGVEPNVMGMGPVPAIENVLKKANWTRDEVDLYEINEAYAVASLACERSLKLDRNKINVAGGTIALGHPLGASGARVVVTLLHLLERLDKRKGVASLCIGGGMGIAIAVERL